LRGYAVVAEKLAKKYPGGVWGVVDASFQVEWGRVAVLLGPNGAGKTTTVGMLTTILKPTKGRGLVAGYDVVREPSSVRRVVALVPQEARIDLNWTPLEAVKWYLVLRGLPLSKASSEAKRVLSELGLWSKRDRPGWSLSGGERRKTLVAMVLASGADVIFLDEPTAGLDVESRYVVWSAVRSASREGRTIIFTTHDMREAEMLADVAIFIYRGRVIASGPPSRLRESLPYTYRVVARKPLTRIEELGYSARRLGDTVIVYARSRREADSIASSIEAESISIEHVTFEDVYMYYVSRGGEA
jgi:ABC-2 type transport system ATP-binding protein